MSYPFTVSMRDLEFVCPSCEESFYKSHEYGSHFTGQL